MIPWCERISVGDLNPFPIPWKKTVGVFVYIILLLNDAADVCTLLYVTAYNGYEKCIGTQIACRCLRMDNWLDVDLGRYVSACYAIYSCMRMMVRWNANGPTYSVYSFNWNSFSERVRNRLLPTHLLIVNLQKRCFQYEIRVRLALLQQLEEIEERPKHQPVPFVGRIRFAADEQLGRSGQRVRFARTGLAVAECRTAEPLDGHLDDALDAGILQHIVLRGARLENDIVAEQFRFLAARRTARDAIALQMMNLLSVWLFWGSHEWMVVLWIVFSTFTNIWPFPGNCVTSGSLLCCSLWLSGRTLCMNLWISIQRHIYSCVGKCIISNSVWKSWLRYRAHHYVCRYECIMSVYEYVAGSFESDCLVHTFIHHTYFVIYDEDI